MAPTRQKKRKSTESTSSVDVQNFPAPPKLVPTKMQSPSRAPNSRSPIRKAPIGITISQKQALIDNLQLEITERARKLRAQYMLQAQGLRTRVEIRVNRIPMALRKANMGDLLLKHSENKAKLVPAIAPGSPAKHSNAGKNLIQREQSRASPSPRRPTKRHSDEITTDKENEDIENPKKRTRGPPQPPDRTTSRVNLQPDQVLSPRSANSRTLPKSPIRPTVPPKTGVSRPPSPLKPAVPASSGGAASILTNMVEKAKTTRGMATRKAVEPTTASGVGRGKRAVAAAPAPKVGRGRAASDSSNGSGSTVIRKSAPAPKKAAPATKRTVMSTIKGIGAGASTKKAPGPKVAPAAAPAGGRVLRKRT
ncbi:Borealin N terminal-domain-containing protein [Bisporella sp. PMI_857]|nr:Borealin N terminal-domain-containing protein [Bisporella sp. PMI_857]